MGMDAAIEVVRGVGIGGATILVTWLGVKQTGKKNKVDSVQQLIDQLQEERDTARRQHVEDMDRMEKRVEKAEKTAENAVTKADGLAEDIRAAHRRELVRDDFIQELRNHIRLGLGPPPPEWPEELRRG